MSTSQLNAHVNTHHSWCGYWRPCERGCSVGECRSNGVRHVGVSSRFAKTATVIPPSSSLAIDVFPCVRATSACRADRQPPTDLHCRQIVDIIQRSRSFDAAASTPDFLFKIQIADVYKKSLRPKKVSLVRYCHSQNLYFTTTIHGFVSLPRALGLNRSVSKRWTHIFPCKCDDSYLQRAMADVKYFCEIWLEFKFDALTTKGFTIFTIDYKKNCTFHKVWYPIYQSQWVDGVGIGVHIW